MYCSNCGKNIGDEANYCQYCGTRVVPNIPPTSLGAPRRFVRLAADKKIAGVCAGVARYFDLDPTLVRVLWVVCLLFAGTGGLLYIILWIIMPLEPEPPLLPA